MLKQMGAHKFFVTDHKVARCIIKYLVFPNNGSATRPHLVRSPESFIPKSRRNVSVRATQVLRLTVLGPGFSDRPA